MLRSLHALHKCGIVVRDIKDHQYINGVLVDFSHAFTIPHVCGPEMGIFPPWTFASMAAWDLDNFQGYIIDQWNNFHCRLCPGLKRTRLVAYKDPDNSGSNRMLRPRADTQTSFLPLLNHERVPAEMTQFPTHDPALFNWRAVERGKRGGKGPVPSKKRAALQSEEKADTEREPKRARQRRK